MFKGFRSYFSGAGFYRIGMFVGAVGVCVFLGIGVYYVVDYFTRFILPDPLNTVACVFIAAFIEYKAISLFLNGFQAIEEIKRTHEQVRDRYEEKTGLQYQQSSGEWAVWAQFVVVIIMDTAGNFFRIWTAQQDTVRSAGAFVIYECLVFLPFLAGYSIYKQTNKPVELVREDFTRKWELEDLQDADERRAEERKRTKLLVNPLSTQLLHDDPGGADELEMLAEEQQPTRFPRAQGK